MFVSNTTKEYMERQQQVIPFCSHKKANYPANSGYWCFSNWRNSKFIMQVTGVDNIMDFIEFNSVEQYMMYSKARVMLDKETAIKVLQHNYFPNGEPDEKWDTQMKAIKQLGREVKNFNAAIWDANCLEIVTRGIMAKFAQNAEMKGALLATGDAILCEAAHYDKVWGVGLSIDNSDVYDLNKWKGKNLLGHALMDTRENLQ